MLKPFNLLTTEELATELGMSVAAVQRWTRMRVIPSIYVGPRTRFYELDAVRRALMKRAVRETSAVA